MIYDLSRTSSKQLAQLWTFSNNITSCMLFKWMNSAIYDLIMSGVFGFERHCFDLEPTKGAPLTSHHTNDGRDKQFAPIARAQQQPMTISSV
jgi:hypothetical protein